MSQHRLAHNSEKPESRAVACNNLCVFNRKIPTDYPGG